MTYSGPSALTNNHLGLANSMGLFLQKTNIIRDYLEDYVRSRRFVVLWCLHFLGWTRIHLTMKWVVSFSILSAFWARCSCHTQVDGRAFWPRSVWMKYATIQDLGDFTRPAARGGGDAKCIDTDHAKSIVTKGASHRALHCLNDLVADALELVPDALEYLSRLKTPEVYRFCAIPQVMAVRDSLRVL